MYSKLARLKGLKYFTAGRRHRRQARRVRRQHHDQHSGGGGEAGTPRISLHLRGHQRRATGTNAIKLFTAEIYNFLKIS